MLQLYCPLTNFFYLFCGLELFNIFLYEDINVIYHVRIIIDTIIAALVAIDKMFRFSKLPNIGDSCFTFHLRIAQL